MERFDYRHYNRVRDQREKLGLPVETLSQKVEHPLTGKQVLKDGQVYNVESVWKQWEGGWYLALLLERNKSHAQVWYQWLGEYPTEIFEMCQKDVEVI